MKRCRLRFVGNIFQPVFTQINRAFFRPQVLMYWCINYGISSPPRLSCHSLWIFPTAVRNSRYIEKATNPGSLVQPQLMSFSPDSVRVLLANYYLRCGVALLFQFPLRMSLNANKCAQRHMSACASASSSPVAYPFCKRVYLSSLPVPAGIRLSASSRASAAFALSVFFAMSNHPNIY